MNKLLLIITASILPLMFFSCTSKQEKMENKLRDLITKLEAEIAPLTKEENITSWDASISGKDEDYQKSADAKIKLVKLFSDTNLFAQLKEIKESGLVKDSVLNRQMEILYPLFLQNQVNKDLLEKVINMESELEKKYSNFRADVNGKKVSDNEIEGILSTSTNSKELEAAWKAHKMIGKEVSADVIAIVKLRNQIAKELGYENYHTMNMTLSEQNPTEILSLFNELDSLTKDTFAELKGDIDTYFAKRYGIAKEKLMPWHYQNRFFQEAPKIYDIDLDQFYSDKNLVDLTAKYYNGINLNVDDLIKKSDLFEKPGKNQHAYCTDIDRNGDVRVLCNVKPTMGWMNTMLHEYGHAVYSRYYDPQKPFLFRESAHTFTTEAIAMMNGRNASNPQWMLDMGIITADQKAKIADVCNKSLRLEQLTFSRWAQVMYRFEKAMYADPDQDLNALWWALVEKYQLLKKPEGRNEPDWASKIHVALYPCYYHNYLMGELLASQLFYYISDNVLKNSDYKNVSFVNHPEVGNYLKEKVFKSGKYYQWNDMIQRATGEKLTAKYYAKQFVEK
ncbi:MAG: M2 family metallopeptidase [Bacteroidales bacterium]|nr:M2 family metallopeptidase [Bacteroidales bacterium]